jgi:hypothetical protein
MEQDLRPTPAEIVQGLGKTLAAIAGVVAALLILPTLPNAFFAALMPDPDGGNVTAVAPVLFVVSVAAALFCLKRFTILRCLLAILPTGFVLFHWLS